MRHKFRLPTTYYSKNFEIPLFISRTFEMDAFCVENTWDEWDSSALVYNEHSQDEEALALTCDMCKEEVNIILW